VVSILRAVGEIDQGTKGIVSGLRQHVDLLVLCDLSSIRTLKRIAIGGADDSFLRDIPKGLRLFTGSLFRSSPD
jgi:hypothetical protein